MPPRSTTRSPITRFIRSIALAAGLVLIAVIALRLEGGDADAALTDSLTPETVVEADKLAGTLPKPADSGGRSAADRKALPAGDPESHPQSAQESGSPAPLLLHIRDARTGDDLDRIEMLHEARFNPRRIRRSRGGPSITPRFSHRAMAGPLPVHPGPGAELESILRDGVSPLSFQSPPQSGRLWIRVEGYSWESIELEDAAGPRWLYLFPACRADVRIIGRLPGERVTVHVQGGWQDATQRTTILEFVAEEEVTTLTGLAAEGLRFVATAVAEDGSRRRSQDWRGMVDHGVQIPVDLHLRALPSVRVDVRMEPRQRETSGFERIELRSMDDADRDELSWSIEELQASTIGHRLLWSTPDLELPVGRYSVCLWPSGQAMDFNLDLSDETHRVSVDLAETSLCRVRCIDSETGAPLPTTMLSRQVLESGYMHRTQRDLRRDHLRWRSLETNDGLISLPYGLVFVRSNNTDHVGRSHEFLIDSPRSEITVPLTRAAVLELSLRSPQGVTVPDFDQLQRTLFRDAEGDRFAKGPPTITVGRDFVTMNYRVDCDGPARIELELAPDLTAHPDDLDVQLRRGEAVQHTVRLIER
jgi:hypothetical protein